MIKVGDIIDGRRITSVYSLCGGIAYQSEPVKDAKSITREPVKIEDIMPEPEPVIEPVEEEKPKRGRRRKEA